MSSIFVLPIGRLPFIYAVECEFSTKNRWMHKHIEHWTEEKLFRISSVLFCGAFSALLEMSVYERRNNQTKYYTSISIDCKQLQTKTKLRKI